MNKSELEKYIATKYSISQKEASNIIDVFTGSITSVLGEGKEVQLIGFGNFVIADIPARAGRNPRTGEVIQIPSYKQPKFKVSPKLKAAVNK